MALVVHGLYTAFHMNWLESSKASVDVVNVMLSL